MSHFQFTPTFLLTAMADKFLTVPRYQRSYAWTEDEVRDFWDDMGKSIKEKTEYFMGTIVLSEESETDDQSIIDGQQRLATTTILLSVLRDVFRERGQDAPADAIQQQYLAPYDVTALTRRARLRLNTSDNPFYESEIIDSKGIPPTADSHHLIRAAKQFFRTNIDKIVSENPKSWTTMFAEITSYLQKQARVILVTAPTNADAFTIFETLNDRGADLTIADLLKNYLFSVSGSELDFVQDAWVETISVLNLYQENREFVGFLRHLWSSMYGATRERDLYKNIKAVISDKSSAVQFAKTLRDGAKIYGAILSAESETWKKFTKVTREHVDTLVQLNLEQNRPLLLALLQHFAPAELAKTLKALVAWSVRGLVAGSIGGGKAEKYFCDAAVDIRAGKIKKPRNCLRKWNPSCRMIRHSVRTLQNLGPRRGRWRGICFLRLSNRCGTKRSPNLSSTRMLRR